MGTLSVTACARKPAHTAQPWLLAALRQQREDLSLKPRTSSPSASSLSKSTLPLLHPLYLPRPPCQLPGQSCPYSRHTAQGYGRDQPSLPVPATPCWPDRGGSPFGLQQCILPHLHRPSSACSWPTGAWHRFPACYSCRRFLSPIETSRPAPRHIWTRLTPTSAAQDAGPLQNESAEEATYCTEPSLSLPGRPPHGPLAGRHAPTDTPPSQPRATDTVERRLLCMNGEGGGSHGKATTNKQEAGGATAHAA
jgi:hypothetical protein